MAGVSLSDWSSIIPPSPSMPDCVAVASDTVHPIAAVSKKDLRIFPQILQDLLYSEQIAEAEDEAEPTTRYGNEIDDRKEMPRTI